MVGPFSGSFSGSVYRACHASSCHAVHECLPCQDIPSGAEGTHAFRLLDMVGWNGTKALKKSKTSCFYRASHTPPNSAPPRAPVPGSARTVSLLPPARPITEWLSHAATPWSPSSTTSTSSGPSPTESMSTRSRARTVGIELSTVAVPRAPQSAAARRAPWSIARLASSSAATSAPPMTCTDLPDAVSPSTSSRKGS